MNAQKKLAPYNSREYALSSEVLEIWAKGHKVYNDRAHATVTCIHWRELHTARVKTKVEQPSSRSSNCSNIQSLCTRPQVWPKAIGAEELLN